ncbi:MAG TPA: zf-HC2 domain-containing protein [Thermoanaerobaculia bacterium]
MTDPTVHATEDEIASYHAGTLPPDEEARVQDHLLECSECTELLLGLDELTLEDDDPAPSEEVRAAWEDLRSRLPAAAAPPLPAPLPYPRPRRQPAWLPALAAGLAAAVVGLGVWNVSLQGKMDELSRPDVNSQFVELSSSTFRGEGTADAPVLKPQGRLVTLALRPDNPRGFADYEVELAGADGTVIWSGKGLRRQESGYFFLTLPRRLLERGDRLRLWGIEEGRREPLGEHKYSQGASAPPEGR